ncbi:hypothetical protein MPSEU_000116100 [Mayamaea pseudoterrestris]|nr:hypothetical protein MPSEU_000116100 [Mayamaea pseudoterrestris]
MHGRIQRLELFAKNFDGLSDSLRPSTIMAASRHLQLMNVCFGVCLIAAAFCSLRVITTSSNYATRNLSLLGLYPMDQKTALLLNETHQPQGENVSIPSQFPRFIVIGAQKGGTTALTEILKRHPNVMANRLAPKEPHFFDFYVTKQDEPYSDPAFLCGTRQRYLREYFNLNLYQRLSKSRPIMAFEKTPSYIRYVGTAYRVYQTLGRSVKLIAVLRNPVERAYSSYKMEHERGVPMDESFDVLIRKEIEALRSAGLTKAPLMKDFDEQLLNHEYDSYSFAPVGSMTFAQRREIVQNTTTPQKGRLRKMKDNTIYAGMYATQLSEWLQYYTLGVDLMVIQSERMTKSQAHLLDVLTEVQEFLGLPVVEFSTSVVTKVYSPVPAVPSLRGLSVAGKEVDRLSDRTSTYLKAFYKSYNSELADLLGEDWRGVWD